MRRIATTIAVLIAGAAALASGAGADDTHTYRVEMYNAFGLVPGSNVRIAGVDAGTVKSLAINEEKRAVVTIELSGELGTLGKDTRCSSEPQSLIAEYFLTCSPKGPPLPENGEIPAEHVSQTVQNDLVQNTLREPFRRRLTLLVNEFGTALAGNADSLNEAIRLGAPSLQQLHKVTSILASQNAIIRDLNANSDQVIGRLTARREDVVRFIKEARDTAEASVARRDDLSHDFEILDDFLAELRPTLAELENAARANTPLLTDLRAAAPGLNQLALNLVPFSDASRVSLDSLGEASKVGKTALDRGRDEIRLLAESGKKAPVTGEMLADFLRDLDDPRRAVEIDDRVPKDTGRDNPNPGQSDTKGYTGLEGLLNYAYYQAGAVNQFDQVGHLLHFTLYDIDNGPCGKFSSGRNPDNGQPGVPAQDGGTTTNILDANACVGWLGPNQPGINEDLNLPKYDPSVCPNGTSPQAAEDALCSPSGSASTNAKSGSGSGGSGSGGDTGAAGGGGTTGGDTGSGSDGGGLLPGQTPGSGTVPDDLLDDILGQGGGTVDDLQDQLGGGGQDQSGGGGGGTVGDAAGDAVQGGDQAAEDLLDFLFH
jgi:virulence factor Mce-like protein